MYELKPIPGEFPPPDARNPRYDVKNNCAHHFRILEIVPSGLNRTDEALSLLNLWSALKRACVGQCLGLISVVYALRHRPTYTLGYMLIHTRSKNIYSKSFGRVQTAKLPKVA